MSEAEILLEIRRIAHEQLGLERELGRGDDLSRDLGLDSVQRIELAVALEDRFCVELQNPDAAQARTVGDVVDLIQRAKS
jgi:acyl carrier protein